MFTSCFETTAVAASKKPKLNVKTLNLTLTSSFNLRVYNLKKKMKVKYTSTDEDVVTVTSLNKRGKKARLEPEGVGTCTIIAQVLRGRKKIKRLKCNVTISPSAVSIKFLRKKLRIAYGDQFRVTPIIKPNTSNEQPVFESEDPSIATVNSQGVITGVAEGTTYIKATLLSTGQTAKCKVRVFYPEDFVPSSTYRPIPTATADSQ